MLDKQVVLKNLQDCLEVVAPESYSLSNLLRDKIMRLKGLISLEEEGHYRVRLKLDYGPGYIYGFYTEVTPESIHLLSLST